jgi:two-component system KDP operon response regulator KdpE
LLCSQLLPINLKPNPIALVVDPDRGIRRLLRVVLEPSGYKVVEASDAGTGLRKTVECNPDVIILEMALPDRGGPAFLGTLKEWSQVPILVLSERTDDEAKVAALDAGARDYLTKPFSHAELLARLRVLQRALPNMPDGPLLVDGGLVANLVTNEIKLHGRSISLTPRERALFYVLARYAGRVVTCSHLTRAVWGVYSECKIHDLRVLVSSMRKKLRTNGAERLIVTEGNLGYRLLLTGQSQLAGCLAVSPSDDTEAAPVSA